MSSKTKILVLKLKEIVYTLIFAALAIILIVLLFLIFSGKNRKNESAPTSADTFIPGIYTSSIILSSSPVDIEVTVNKDQIKSISLVNTSSSVETMYPLISSSLDSIASQVIRNSSTENITYTADSIYTSLVLIKAIDSALQKAAPQN